MTTASAQRPLSVRSRANRARQTTKSNPNVELVKMFDARRARRDMRAFSKRGATRRPLDAVRASLRERCTAVLAHLDIGGGVGILQHGKFSERAVPTLIVGAWLLGLL